MGSLDAKMPVVKCGGIFYDGKSILYVVKAIKTSYTNYMIVLIMAEELGIDYDISVVVTKDEWYYRIYPERYVPTIRDQDPFTKQEIIVFESTACLQYLAEIYAKNGLWHGKTEHEKDNILSWISYQTAGLGATSKYWLYFYAVHQEKLPETIHKCTGSPNDVSYIHYLKTNIQVLRKHIEAKKYHEKRLSEPGQTCTAQKDRPTVADLAYLPFAMLYMFEFMQIKIGDRPRIKE